MLQKQVLLLLGFSRQEYWSGSPCPPLRDLPNPGKQPVTPVSPKLQVRFFFFWFLFFCFLPLSHSEAPLKKKNQIHYRSNSHHSQSAWKEYIFILLTISGITLFKHHNSIMKLVRLYPHREVSYFSFPPKCCKLTLLHHLCLLEEFYFSPNVCF